MIVIDDVVRDFLRVHDLAGPDAQLTPLSGGVSSAIWLVEDGVRRLVVKQPLERLKVAGPWHASMDRSDSEAGWLRVVGDLIPAACPRVLSYDDEAHLLALVYLDPAVHRLWKDELLAGRVDPGAARQVGARLGAIHAATSQRPELAADFARDDLFDELRIDPYLRSLLDVHPAVHGAIESVIDQTMSTKLALVHGDASPKNILLGPEGPVFLDAETAWWGDPAFDLAFCLNHLLLKTLLPRAPRARLDASVTGLIDAYRAGVSWEDWAGLEARVIALLPALMLARIDGRSPVEYLDESARSLTRNFALAALASSSAFADLHALTDSWRTYPR